MLNVLVGNRYFIALRIIDNENKGAPCDYVITVSEVFESPDLPSDVITHLPPSAEAIAPKKRNKEAMRDQRYS